MINILIRVIILLGLSLAQFSYASNALEPRLGFDVESRIDSLVSQMTLEEKVSLLGGTGFDTRAIPRLGIPAMRMTDGPLGVRTDQGPATAFPAAIALGASFDPALVKEVATAIADETRYFGYHVLLGPCVNIARHPMGGRNFESFGEDPFLNSLYAADYVKGIQGQNILASVKHFAGNDQEAERTTIDTIIDTRTLFEMHLPAFKSGVEAGTWTVMSAYNLVNGHYATSNHYLQNYVLKGLWKYDGLVVSDWGATHDVVGPALNGLDLEMPTGEHFGERLVQAVRDGLVPEATIEDKVRRILRPMFAIGLMEPSRAKPLPPPIGPNSPEHRALALKVAQEGTVLLKNDGILPLDPRRVRSIAVIGPNANVARTGGGGSSHVDPLQASTPLQGLRDRLNGQNVRIQFSPGTQLPNEVSPFPAAQMRPSMDSTSRGLRGEYFANKDFSGEPFMRRLDRIVDFQFIAYDDSRMRTNFSIRWTGFIQVPQNGRYQLATNSDDGVRLFLDDKAIISNWTGHPPTVDVAEVDLVAGRWYPIRLEYYQDSGGASITFGLLREDPSRLQEAVQAARRADVAVIFTGLSMNVEGEGVDPTFRLPAGQSEMIDAVAAANPNTVVVLTGGNPLPLDPWLPKVKGLLQNWYGGQEGGDAIADILLGRVNPSGKLPVTFLKRWEDSPAFGNYPGEHGRVEYKEGIFVGYRHFDRAGIAPHFPFGFGLSYTTFQFSNLRLVDESTATDPKFRVEFDVKNTGARSGAEVAQVYVGELEPMQARPVRELKGIQKVFLNAGESRRLSIPLDSKAFASFDAGTMTWTVNPGDFRISVGSSSRDLKLEDTVTLRTSKSYTP